MNEFRGRARFWVYVTTAVVGLIVVAPFAWIFVNSIKNQIDIYTGTLVFVPVWTNYDDLLFGRRSDFLLNVQNSAIVASVSTVLVMIVGTLAAYALSRFRYARWFAAGFLAWTLVFHMIPPITLVGPWYLTFRQLGLFNTLSGLVLTHVTINLPMTIWLMMSFFQDVPKELEEAALIDGCRRVGAFLRVSLPLAVPGLVAAGILAFIFSWNEFSIALNLTTSDTATVPVGIARFAQQYEVRHGEMAAASVLATIPALILMFVGQRFIVKGLTLGSLK
jgi:multiple sugar transport system permease protein